MNSSEAAGIFGVDPTVVTLDEVRTAYRAIAKVTHPDAGGDPAEFRRLGEAKTVLEAHVERRTRSTKRPTGPTRRLRPEDFGHPPGGYDPPPSGRSPWIDPQTGAPRETRNDEDFAEAMRKLADSMRVPGEAFRAFSEDLSGDAAKARRQIAKVRLRSDGAIEVTNQYESRAVFYLPKPVLDAIDEHLQPRRRNQR